MIVKSPLAVPGAELPGVIQAMDYLTEQNQVIGGEQIVKLIWTASTEPTSNVLAAQIRLLRRKLTEIGSSCSIETLYGMGYRFNIILPPE